MVAVAGVTRMPAATAMCRIALVLAVASVLGMFGSMT
jgi:hypothetical protein